MAEGKSHDESSAAYTLTGVNASTTDTRDQPGLLLSVGIEDGNYIVKDLIGTRYGFAPFLKDALESWAEQVEDILGMSEPLGPPLSFEVARYRKALSR